MKKNRIFAFLGLSVLLFSCGGTPVTSSLGPTSEEIALSESAEKQIAKNEFDLYKEASNKTMAHDNVGIDCQNGRMSFSFESDAYLNIVEAGVKTFEVNPLNFSLRMGNLHTEDSQKASLSLEMEDSKGVNTKITFDGFGSLFSMLGNSIKCAPNFYLEEGTAYLDLADAAFARLLVNRLGKKILDDPDFAIPTKGFAPIDGKALDFINRFLPIDDYLATGTDKAIEAMKDAYDKAKESFSFETAGDVHTIVYSPSTFEDVRKTIEGGAKDASVDDSLEGAIDSYADEAEKIVTIVKAETRYSFSSDALLGQSYDFTLRFDKEKGKEIFGADSFLPVGDFVFKADLVYVLDETPVRLSDTKKKSFEEFDMDKLIDSIKGLFDNEEEETQDSQSE